MKGRRATMIEKLRWLELKESLKYGLRAAGIVLLAVGVSCMPLPLVNPKLTTSLFHALAAAGLLVRYGLAMIVVGAVLFGSSFLIRQR